MLIRDFIVIDNQLPDKLIFDFSRLDEEGRLRFIQALQTPGHIYNTDDILKDISTVETGLVEIETQQVLDELHNRTNILMGVFDNGKPTSRD